MVGEYRGTIIVISLCVQKIPFSQQIIFQRAAYLRFREFIIEPFSASNLYGGNFA